MAARWIARIRNVVDHVCRRILPQRVAVIRSTDASDPVRVLAGRSSGRQHCTGCGVAIPEGAVEYEIVGAAQTQLLDRACFVRWEQARGARAAGDEAR
jgi:hypothetical protein